MPDGAITFRTDLDNAKLEKDLAKITAKIMEAEKKLSEKKSSQSAIKAELTSAKEEAKKTEDAIKQIQTRISELRDTGDMAGIKNPVGLSEAQAELKQQEAILRTQDNEVAQLDRQYTKITDSVIESTNSLSEMETKAGELTNQIARASSKTSAFDGALGGVNKRLDNLSSRISRLVSRVLVFSVFTSALRSMRTWLGNVIKTNDEATVAMARLKGALLTMAQPIVDFIVPAFTLLCNIFTRVITLISKLLSTIFGGSFSAAKKSAEALSKEQKAIEDVGGAAKEAGKYLAGFDELNVMPDNSQNSGGGGISADASAPDFNFDTGMLTQKLDEIAVYVAGALLALGAVLAFTGANIPLGLGLMAIGALTLAAEIKENWNAMDDGVQNAIDSVILILGMAGLVIGAILAFTGANVPLGIGLMVVSAAALAAEAALNWETISTALQGPIGTVVTLVSSALLVLGAILAFTGAALPLGIGLMAVGVVGLATAVSINWNTIIASLQGPLGTVAALVSGALLVLGAILAFTGAALPLGIGLIAVGAIGLTATVRANWDTIVTALQGPIGVITGIVSAALLVLGVILLLTGAGIPLGLGLIAAGAVGLGTAIAVNWDFIVDKIKGVWQAIKDFWNGKIVPGLRAVGEFVGKIFDGIWNGIKTAINWVLGGINGLMSGITNGINFVIRALNKLHFDIPDWIPGIGGKTFGFNIPEIKAWQIPLLAKGAVIPPNAPFAAVLGDQRHGTNVEAPLDTIKQAVAEVLRGNSGGNPNVHVTIVLDSVDGKKLFDAMVKQNNAVVRATGTSPLKV